MLLWIAGGGILMTAIALVGSVTLLLPKATPARWLLPLVAFAAGSLLAGAFLHMLPAALSRGPALWAFSWTLAGFALFLALEQLLHWHQYHRPHAYQRQPLTYLILVGDGLHNLLGGLAVAGAFLIDIRVGITAWLAAAAHEIPQELGDFGALVHGGMPKGRALALNVLSGSLFLVGGLLTYVLSLRMDLSFLLPFAAGNFIYIGAADLVPEVNRQRSLGTSAVHFLAFGAGVVVLLGLRLMFRA